ncbi:DUF7331 family protein [Haloarchaeobius amylolyticus]|uniref:DUF7331 family protein n=1 Tax=Haloarchaeobius amylolyticus TaxID=1198296 RepID=UPI002270F69C|nr:hypothetical protein [Haloarchaeobius amylolyticus]
MNTTDTEEERYVGRETVNGLIIYDRENLDAWIESDTTVSVTESDYRSSPSQ